MEAGVYIHIPFCRTRCSYCDFATGIYQASLAERYVRAVCREIEGWNEVAAVANVDTIYFGGGTPSLLSPTQIESLLGAVRQRFNVLPDTEVTMEINPGTVTEPRSGVKSAAGQSEPVLAGEDAAPADLRAFRKLGINRASFGAQTFDDTELRQLGRAHDSRAIRQTFVELRRAGFDNISFDLIAGLPGQSMAHWQRNLDEALALRPEHLSLYLLDVHEGTPLADQIKRGVRPQPDDDLTAAMYSVMVDRVCAAGYEHYEISNFSLPGYESRHNTKYWTGAPYYGFGCSAHSYDGHARRWANERDAARYTKLVESETSPVVERTTLTETEARAETMFLGLRLMRGLNSGLFQARHGADPRVEYQEPLARFREAGLIEVEGDLIRLTQSGALLSNEVFAAFL